jgi:hypothetical protein
LAWSTSIRGLISVHLYVPSALGIEDTHKQSIESGRQSGGAIHPFHGARVCWPS